MCGRFTLMFEDKPEFLEAEFPGIAWPQGIPPRYNIAPTQSIWVVTCDGTAKIEPLRWGLIPSWAKDPSIGNRMINARAETAADKPPFRGPFKSRRCLILASGFYEWTQRPGVKNKTPHYIFLPGAPVFAIAGLWDAWRSPDGETVRSCSILTTSANELVRPLHDRMPVILPQASLRRWIGADPVEKDELLAMLRPYPADTMRTREVSPRVNRPTYDAPDCLAQCPANAPED